MLNSFFSLFQLAKKEIWRSHNLKNENSTGCLSSLVLDELPQQESHKENRFIYHFVCRCSPTNNLSGSDRNSISAAASLTKDLDCNLKSGDYVVRFLAFLLLLLCHSYLHIFRYVPLYVYIKSCNEYKNDCYDHHVCFCWEVL